MGECFHLWRRWKWLHRGGENLNWALMSEFHSAGKGKGILGKKVTRCGKAEI